MTQSDVRAAADRFAGPENSARRTLAGLVASALAVLPLHEIFTDWAWLPNVWLAMLLTIGPAALLRMRWTASGLQLLPGLVITACFLTARFVPDHAWGGFLPLHGAWSDIAVLNGDFHDTLRDSAAPLHSTPAVRMVLAALLVLLAVAVDLVAVVARRPALAGVPFLLLFTLAGAMPRHAVGWIWFALAALGYLLLLSSDARDEVSRWGRLMPHTAGASRAAVKALSARRIAVIAIVVALAIPLLLPVRKSNLLADAIHGGTGSGGGGGVSLDPFVTLKGQLNRTNPIDLLEVSTTGLGEHRPLYLNELVLDTYNASGWHAGPRGQTEPLPTTSFGADPDTAQPIMPTVEYTATVTSRNLSDVAAPLFKSPTRIQGLSDNWVWSRQDAALLGGRVQKGDSYTETVQEPLPSITALQHSGSVANSPALQRWLQHPVMPAEVTTLVTSLTRGKSSPYARAVAILEHFGTDNGFTYSLETKTGDSGSDLVDFLRNKTGFCQQYAAAMAIMLRMAEVPARVVVGYTHPAPDKDGKFTVTSNDAHAWVEGYFAGAGWLPFDPTPLTGTNAGRAAQIPWAPRATGSAPSAPATGSSIDRPSAADKQSSAAAGGNTSTSTSSGGGLPAWGTWLLLGVAAVVIIVFLLPASVRLWRRRGRLRASAHGPDPLWRELADTAIDLGYVWSPVRTPRQVVIWLRREGVRGEADGALQTLAGAVEVSRYAAPRAGVATRELVTDLRRIEVSLRASRTRWERVRARLLPESLGWLARVGRRH